MSSGLSSEKEKFITLSINNGLFTDLLDFLKQTLKQARNLQDAQAEKLTS